MGVLQSKKGIQLRVKIACENDETSCVEYRSAGEYPLKCIRRKNNEKEERQ